MDIEVGKLVLLADPESNSWNFSKKIKDYIQKVKEIDYIPLEEIEIKQFRNKEILPHVLKNIRQKDIYFIHDSTKDPQEWWVELLLIKDLLLDSSAHSVSFVLPNMLYSRQDRKDKPHVPISARTLAKSISPKLRKIITMDLHAKQIQGMYDAGEPSMDNLDSFPELVRHFEDNYLEKISKLCIVSPDVGSAQRSRNLLDRLEKSKNPLAKNIEFYFAIVDKVRPRPGEVDKKKMHIIGDNVKGIDCLVVDDMIDTGGTSCTTAELLKEKEANLVYGYATHGLFTKGLDELCKSFDCLMTSNTHHQNDDRLDVIDMSGLFAEAIYNAQTGKSISKLFK